ncbi:MAG: Bug family tripartite tricarboxylate transporter substrate binding protein, partial [Burkholderiales bacterium]
MRLFLLLLAALLPALATAQAYPAKQIRIVVPWAPGGSTDVLARLIGIKLTENWGQPAVVENKPGASGNIGSELVVKAPPDGYTLLVGSVSTHAMNPFLVASMPFKGVDDFTTIALAAYVTNVLVTHPSVPAKSVPELIALLKAQPGKVAYASAGNGSPNHVAAELFRRLAVVDMAARPV